MGRGLCWHLSSPEPLFFSEAGGACERESQELWRQGFLVVDSVMLCNVKVISSCIHFLIQIIDLKCIFFGLAFVLYFLKFSDGKGFFKTRYKIGLPIVGHFDDVTIKTLTLGTFYDMNLFVC